MKHKSNTDQAEYLIFDWQFLIANLMEFGFRRLGLMTWGCPGREVMPRETSERVTRGKGFFYRISAGYYQMIAGFSHLWTASTRFLPHVSTQVVDFPGIRNASIFWGEAKNAVLQAEEWPGGDWDQDGIVGNGVREFWGVGQRTGGGFVREKVRIVTGCCTEVRESSHRSGPWLRDFTHCYGYELFWRIYDRAAPIPRESALDMQGLALKN